MIIRFGLILYLIGLLLGCFLIFQGCKNESTVQPVENKNQGSNLPILITPENGTSSRSLTPTFVWQSFPSASSYHIQVSLDANMAGTILIDSSGISGLTIQAPAGRLNTNVYYYWRVKAFLSSNDSSDWSGIWRFNIILNAPAPPFLIAPPNNSINQSFLPTLQWSYVDSAQFYRVQISRFQNFSSFVFDSNRISLNQILIPHFILNTGTQYYWRANASNSNGISISQWSSIFNFTTVPGPQPNSISGRITFVDTNFVSGPDYYSVAAYNSWPPGGSVAGTDSLVIVKSGNVYHADYTIPRLYDGNYYVAVNTGTAGIVSFEILGIYGCDTVHLQYSNCPANPSTVQIQNNIGIENINFLSWADTTKRIF